MKSLNNLGDSDNNTMYEWKSIGFAGSLRRHIWNYSEDMRCVFENQNLIKNVVRFINIKSIENI
tara:strand:+ start:1657 stop:1848 length:192 start_codon:yes stop_codon:yes gene_type:complete